MTLDPLLQASPAIRIHAFAAIAAFLLGALVLWRRKGDRLHRLGGRIWVGLMLVVALSSFFIHTIRMWGPWSPIHLLSFATLASLAYGVAMIRRRNIAAHSGAMRATYVGALVIAGIFTLAPGRIMNHVVFGTAHAAPAAVVRHGTPGVMDIVAGTPLWVWPLLAYLLYIGWRRMHDREISPARLFIMPAVISGLALHSLLASALSPAAVAAFVCGAAAGALAGQAIARRRPAERLDNGMLRVKGDWLPLVLTLGIFAVHYARGAALGIDPALAGNPAFVVASAFASGLFAAVMVARTLGQLPKGGNRSAIRRTVS